MKERKEKKRERYRSEDDEAGHSTCFTPGERPPTTQHGNVTVGTVLKTTLVLAKSPKPLLETQTEVGKQSPLVFRSCYDRWRWQNTPCPAAPGPLSAAGATASGNQPEAETGLSSTRVSFCHQNGTSESLNVPRLGAGQTQKNKQVQQLQAKPSSSYLAFEREVRGRRFYRGTPTQGVPRLIIRDRSSSISSNQNPIRYRIGYLIRSSIPEAARTIIAYPIWT